MISTNRERPISFRYLDYEFDSPALRPEDFFMLPTNIFLKILSKEIPARIIHEDDLCLAFHDVNPQAPVHVLIIPKKEIATHADLTLDDVELMGHLHLVAAQLAKVLGISDGYRIVANCRERAGQTVPHVHFHLLGGRDLGWPPG